MARYYLIQVVMAPFHKILAAAPRERACGSPRRLDYNRQCLAEGIGNLSGGFFQCLPGSGSLTRSAINYQSGALTRVSGIFLV